jgi:hypothetical protein
VAAFPDAPVGLLGGGSYDRTPLLVATYDSAAIQAEALGNRYACLVFDECHHLPSPFTRVIAEFSWAPYRIARDFLIPAITHHTPVKEPHPLHPCGMKSTFSSPSQPAQLNLSIDKNRLFHLLHSALFPI